MKVITTVKGAIRPKELPVVSEFVCPILEKLGHGDDVVDTITKTNPERFLSHG